ncbi:restriction endonuclease subunit S [Rhodoferax sp.]|uniref:restriction endonuclease subunit S n=1 Tax=Rhodoferax sp. TaxID=50421 RepID=UPI0025EB0BD6|nr:restriction endonuclease subunit S [Rhodoferax sp.]
MTTAQLGEIASIVRGIAFPKEDKRAEPLPGHVACLRTTNVQRSVEWEDLWFVPEKHVKREEQIVRPGDILISTANSYELVGKVAPVMGMPHKATLGAFISLIRPNERVEPKFLYHQLAWGKTQSRIRETASTTTNISNVSTKKLLTLDLFTPPLDEQREIVAELEKQFSRLDEAVANLQRVKANLKRYKASVLKAAVEGRLVETEATQAHREGRTFETGEQLLQRILEERRAKWAGKGKYKEPAPLAAGLQDLPEGWTWAAVEMVCDAIVDCPHSTAKFQAQGYPCVDTTWMTTEGLAPERARFVDDATYKDRISRLAPKTGDIVFAREGTIGTAVLIPERMTPCLGQRVMLLRTSPEYSNGLLVHVLHSEVVKTQYRAQALGSTVAHINVGDVKRFAVPVPPVSEQVRILAEVDRHLSIVREVEAEVDTNLKRAQALRQATLAKSFSQTVY